MRLIENKKIGMDYVVTETISCGIELLGLEVKSLRSKLGSIAGSRVLIRGGEAYLIGSFIPPYQENNTPSDYDPYRNRRLLLNKGEIEKLVREEQSNHLTLVPVSLYLKNNLIKIDVGLCKKKLKGDKRENIKKDIARRELRSK